ncbi:hypothetical protein [Nocardiopsis synnemataformans]|uniref:hypothetical protein n=1 Tax=Nocardiopsis synnemataformans TaxID=61305 RepID=UPI003EBD94F6
MPYCGYHLQARELAEAKTEEEWLKAAPSHILQQTLRDLDRACQDHGTFKVRWRAKGRWKPSFRFPDGGRMSMELAARDRTGSVAAHQRLNRLRRAVAGSEIDTDVTARGGAAEGPEGTQRPS